MRCKLETFDSIYNIGCYNASIGCTANQIISAKIRVLRDGILSSFKKPLCSYITILLEYQLTEFAENPMKSRRKYFNDGSYSG